MYDKKVWWSNRVDKGSARACSIHARYVSTVLDQNKCARQCSIQASYVPENIKDNGNSIVF